MELAIGKFKSAKISFKNFFNPQLEKKSFLGKKNQSKNGLTAVLLVHGEVTSPVCSILFQKTTALSRQHGLIQGLLHIGVQSSTEGHLLVVIGRLRVVVAGCVAEKEDQLVSNS